MARGDGAYDHASARWAGVGPYYAMFPIPFADGVIRRYSQPGDLVLDPFAGRGTTVFSAAAAKRHGVGIELNPVGWVYSRTKLSPASRRQVERRIIELGLFARAFRVKSYRLPEFFRWCFAPSVRAFLLAARAKLDWRRSKTDRTVMALILIYLHGKRGQSLSNQMRQAKAMAPDYSVRWWRKHHQRAPKLDPVAFLMRRLSWRYARGVPKLARSRSYRADARLALLSLPQRLRAVGLPSRARLLLTSPPYYAVTNYYYDQWLRLWALGGPPNPRRVGGHFENKFEHQERYASLLRTVFRRAKPLLHRDATIYVRTDSRVFTYKTTRSVLKELFPRKALRRIKRPFPPKTQTHLFGDLRTRDGEVDLVLRPN